MEQTIVPGLYRSAEISDLVAALAAAQAEFATIAKERTAEVVSKRTGGRYSYAYADLADVLDAVRPALAKRGVAIVQCPIEGPGQAGAVTLIAKGEQWMAVSMLVPIEMEHGAQGKGSAITYARRYGLMAILGTAARGEDDDAATVQPSVATNGARSSSLPPPPPPPPPPAAASQVEASGGPLYVAKVIQKPTSKAGITRYEVTLSDGRMASTIHQDIAAAAQAFQVEHMPVKVELESTRWGLNLKAIVPDEGGELSFEDDASSSAEDKDDVVPF